MTHVRSDSKPYVLMTPWSRGNNRLTFIDYKRRQDGKHLKIRRCDNAITESFVKLINFSVATAF